MAIEKVFAVKAEPAEIWDALWRDLGEGEDGAYEVERSSWPTGFSLRLTIGGVPALLTYAITQRAEHCEVLARLEPEGFRYMLYQFVTFGHFGRNFELALVEGLANLKRAVEGEPTDENTSA